MEAAMGVDLVEEEKVVAREVDLEAVDLEAVDLEEEVMVEVMEEEEMGEETAVGLAVGLVAEAMVVGAMVVGETVAEMAEGVMVVADLAVVETAAATEGAAMVVEEMVVAETVAEGEHMAGMGVDAGEVVEVEWEMDYLEMVEVAMAGTVANWGEVMMAAEHWVVAVVVSVDLVPKNNILTDKLEYFLKCIRKIQRGIMLYSPYVTIDIKLTNENKWFQ